jgi:hypothetical protein
MDNDWLDIDSEPAIRDSVRDTVNSLLWLEGVGKGQLDSIKKNGQINSSLERPERCLICTLPFGMCEHSDDWISSHEDERLVRNIQHEIDQEIDDMLDVLKFSPVDISSMPDADDIDLEHIQWLPLDERLIDNIGAASFKLFVPDKRAWHSTVLLGENHVLVFGGMYSQEELPQPFQSITAGSSIALLDDLRVYHVTRRYWQASKYLLSYTIHIYCFICFSMWQEQASASCSIRTLRCILV